MYGGSSNGNNIRNLKRFLNGSLVFEKRNAKQEPMITENVLTNTEIVTLLKIDFSIPTENMFLKPSDVPCLLSGMA